MEKETLRQEMKSRLSLLPPLEFVMAGRDAAIRAQTLPFWNQNKTVLLFASMKNEIDTLPLMEAALEKGKQVYFPRFESGQLCFYRVETPDGLWEKGTFGIMEPLPGKPLKEKDFPALVFTPGLAFDQRGNRLGRGGGFYDRFFAGLENSKLEYTAVGLCLKPQVIDSLPVDEKDKPVQYLIYR